MARGLTRSHVQLGDQYESSPLGLPGGHGRWVAIASGACRCAITAGRQRVAAADRATRPSRAATAVDFQARRRTRRQEMTNHESNDEGNPNDEVPQRVNRHQ